MSHVSYLISYILYLISYISSHPPRILLHKFLPVFGTLFRNRILHLEVMAHSSRQSVGGIQVGRHDGHAEHLFEKIGNLFLGGSPTTGDRLFDAQGGVLENCGA